MSIDFLRSHEITESVRRMLAFVRTFDMIYIANSVLNSYAYMYQRKKQRYFKVFHESFW